MNAELDFKDVHWAAEALGLDEETVINLLESGGIPGVQLGDSWLVSRSSLSDYLRREEKRQTEARRHRPVRTHSSGRRTRKTTSLSFTVAGRHGTTRNWQDLLVEVLAAIASHNSGFLEKFSQEARRTRRYVAKNPRDLYPGRADLAVYSRELTSGWWVGTNYSAKEIESILRKACEVAALTWGVDVQISAARSKVDRTKALGFVGAARDIRPDVARRHDEYFAETLSGGR